MIQARNINWPMFGIIYSVSNTEKAMGRYDATIDSLTIVEPGKYVIFAYGQTGEGDNLFSMSLRQNGSDIATQQGHGSYIQHTSLFSVSDCNANDVLTLVGYANNSCYTKRYHGIIALRIG